MKQIAIHCETNATRAAVLEDRVLIEYDAERADNAPHVGNIYKGRVVNVIPGMQAAFVNIGHSKNAFLYIDDVLPAHLDKQPKSKPMVTELLAEGQDIIVQVSKEPAGTKGARVTTHFFLPGRWVVYMPHAGYVGVSRKIEDEAERERLKAAGERIRQEEEGLIIRTVAERETADAIEQDVRFLRGIWANVCARERQSSAPALLYGELDLTHRLIRDVMSEDVEEIVVDDAHKGNEVEQLLMQIDPKYANRVRMHTGEEPLFAALGIREQLERSFRHKIWLGCGGYLVMDQTEALTVIDVNTGKFTGGVDLEHTVFATNMEAADEAARLIRLRDIGGIILIDFIDMAIEEHRRRIVERLEQKLKSDRTKSHVVGWTRLGLLEMTRKKARENMDSLFFETCNRCGGSGSVYTRLHPLY